MSRLNILPSPCADVVLSPFEKEAYPKFAQLFEVIPESSPLRHFARDPSDAAVSLILENRSEKAITALRYRWVITDQAGEHHRHAVSSDSYMVDVYQPVAEPGSRHLISRSGKVDEALIDHVSAGGGVMGSRISRRSSPDIVDLTFEIDFVLFADGEIAGPDLHRYGIELTCRKPAAEFVAKQIRLAAVEGRDVTPVLTALAAVPCLGRLGHAQGDPLVHWTRRYAGEYLRVLTHKFGDLDMRDARLRHLEHRPELPKFYRRGQP